MDTSRIIENTGSEAAVARADALTQAMAPPRVHGNPGALAKARFTSRDTRAVGLQACLAALALTDRLRFVRTLDVAFHLYADRTFTAALAAANNLMKRMVRHGYLHAHTTRVGGMRIYGIAQRGVNFLRDHTGYEARAHRSLRDVKHPEHRLWANLVVITAEARGLKAMTEREVLAFEHEAGEVVSGERGKERTIPRKLLCIADAREAGRNKGLTSDALLQQGADRIAIEVDTSKRSSGRIRDLLCLATSAVGTKLYDGTRLSRLVVLTKERRFYTHVTGVFARKAGERIERASTYLKRSAEEGVFELWYRPSIAEDEAGRPAEDRRVGWVQVQMLPDIRGLIQGWYDQNWLPYAKTSAEEGWLPIGEAVKR